MIRCPWCGTRYLSFRSNCANCGGPLPLPTDGADDASALPMPPPAPRVISSAYAFRLMGREASAIIGLVLGIVGTVFMLVGMPLAAARATLFVGVPFTLVGVGLLGGGVSLLIWRYRISARIVRVLREGVPTEGRIVSVDADTSTVINGRNPWYIKYEFRAQGNDYQGQVTTLQESGGDFEPKQRVCVLYLTGMPEANSLYPHP